MDRREHAARAAEVGVALVRAFDDVRAGERERAELFGGDGHAGMLPAAGPYAARMRSERLDPAQD